MQFGALARIVIERRNAQDHVRLRWSLSKEVSSAYSTEPSQLTWRRFERSEVFLTAFDPEVRAQNPSRRRERARMGLTAGYAMTMPNWHVELIHVVSDTAAQAAAAQSHGVSSSLRVPPFKAKRRTGRRHHHSPDQAAGHHLPRSVENSGHLPLPSAIARPFARSAQPIDCGDPIAAAG